ncbi:MAG: DUF1844 domain-containing protein [Armatimonadota bacterium]|nr:DUF1844 domain-containing protein [Armatimonadota bacterium]
MGNEHERADAAGAGGSAAGTEAAARSRPGAPTDAAGATGTGASAPGGRVETGTDAAPGGEPVAQPPVLDLVQTFLNVLAARAWQHLGLVPDPSSGKVERRLDDAQLAIDAAAALAEVLRPRVGERDRREVETLITNLRLNFVEQKSRAQ